MRVQRQRIAAELAELYEAEDLIAKLQAVQDVERDHSYAHVPKGLPYWTRITTSLEWIDPAHHSAALAVFANVVYITEPLLLDAMRAAAADVAGAAAARSLSIPNDIHLFAVDHESLIDTFYNAAASIGWGGRLDNLSQRFLRLVPSLIQNLEQVYSFDADRRAQLRSVFERPLWVLLTDNALSGGSVASDAQKLLKIIEAFARDPQPELLICAQVITDDAYNRLRQQLDARAVVHGIRFGDEFRVNNDKCRLFRDPTTRKAVCSLCEWFAAQHFAKMDAGNKFRNTINAHLKLHGDERFAYGWLNGGYTLIMQKNAPTNSLPLLWYPIVTHQPPLVGYVAPFARAHSRMDQVTARDSERLHRLIARADEINKSLWG